MTERCPFFSGTCIQSIPENRKNLHQAYPHEFASSCHDNGSGWAGHCVRFSQCSKDTKHVFPPQLDWLVFCDSVFSAGNFFNDMLLVFFIYVILIFKFIVLTFKWSFSCVQLSS